MEYVAYEVSRQLVRAQVGDRFLDLSGSIRRGLVHCLLVAVAFGVRGIRDQGYDEKQRADGDHALSIEEELGITPES